MGTATVGELRDESILALRRGRGIAADWSPWWRPLLAYTAVTKPKTVILLVFTSFVGMLVASADHASPFAPAMVLLGIVAITAGTAGCNAVTCYLDRDIDAIMNRTMRRPLPSGWIHPPERALWYGLALLGIALLLSGGRNAWALAFMLLGILDNVVVYSLWSKRRSSWNIVLGSLSGGMPLAFGWAWIAGSPSLTMVLMAALVVLWTPTHIWSLALRYRDDYARARVPMLPVVKEEKTALRCMVSTSVLMVPFSLALLFVQPTLGLTYFGIALSLGVCLLALNVWLWLRPSADRAWAVFKFSSPYLAVIFLAMMIGVTVG